MFDGNRAEAADNQHPPMLSHRKRQLKTIRLKSFLYSFAAPPTLFTSLKHTVYKSGRIGVVVIFHHKPAVVSAGSNLVAFVQIYLAKPHRCIIYNVAVRIIIKQCLIAPLNNRVGFDGIYIASIWKTNLMRFATVSIAAHPLAIMNGSNVLRQG